MGWLPFCQMAISRSTDQLWSEEDVWSSSHGLTWTQEFMEQFASKSGVGRHLKPGTFRGLIVLSVWGGCWEVVVKIWVRLGNFISQISLACLYSSPSHFIHSGAGVGYHLLSPEGAQPSLQPSLCLCAHPPLHTWPEWAFWQTDLVTLSPSRLSLLWFPLNDFFDLTSHHCLSHGNSEFLSVCQTRQLIPILTSHSPFSLPLCLFQLKS